MELTTPFHNHPLYQRALAMIPSLRERELQTESERKVPRATLDAFHDGGFLRLMQPSRYGGDSGDIELFSKIVQVFASGCASSGWVYAVLGEMQWVIATFPQQAQDEVWGADRRALACCSLAPRAQAKVVEGGFRLTGSWPFASGCDHAQWVVLGAFSEEHGRQHHLLVPMADLQVRDDWQVLGLRGTGSKTLLLDDVFVPAHRAVFVDELMQGTSPGSRIHQEFSLLQAPRLAYAFFSQPPVTMSLGEKALDYVTQLVRSRIARGEKRVALSEYVQAHLAETDLAIRAALLQFETGRRQAADALRSGVSLDPESVRRMTADFVSAQASVRQSVIRLGEICGTDWVRDSSPFQRILRDTLTAMTHFTASRETWLVEYGKARLATGA